MQRSCHAASLILFLSTFTAADASDWTGFRGPGGLGVSSETGLPIEWSAQKNVLWKLPLPGPGASSPIVVGKRVFVTCYTGYGLMDKDPTDQKELRRHLFCVDLGIGKTLWNKDFEPALPEHKYQGEGSYHGYAASTPTSDGERLYVFFGKSGVFCFDLDGKQVWHAFVGKGTNGWGSGASPVLYKNLLIVNASVESGTMVALDKLTGKEVWKAPGISAAWNTPILATGPAQTPELVVSVHKKIVSLNPDTGKELWKAEGVDRYVCPSVVAHDGIVYAIGGGHTSLAVRAGGTGDVTKSHGLWRMQKGSNVGSPIYHDGHLYWASESGGSVHCQDAATGKLVYSERLSPPSGRIYASPVLVDGKLYYVSQEHGAYVVAAQPKFAQLAHNEFADDKSRTNASPAIVDGRLLIRTDRCLYCIGKR